MAQANVGSTLDANWKEQYGEETLVIPRTRYILQDVPFAAGAMVGDKFIEPVMLTDEHGLTYFGTSTDVVTLEDAEAATYKEAQVDGYGMLLRSQISYQTADKMKNSKQAFKSWSSLMYENMMRGITKRQELDMLYGQKGIGVVDSNGYSSGTTSTIDIKLGEWADGIWSGMKNARIDIYNGATKRNSNADVVVTGVDFDNQRLSISGNATDLAAFAQNDTVYLKGQYDGTTHKSAFGMKAIATASSTIYNIDAGTYELWKGVEQSAGSAAFTLSKILGGVATATGRGLEDDVTILVATQTAKDINTDQAALKRYGGEKKSVNGFDYVEFNHFGVRAKLVPHIYVKNGDAFGYCKSECKRVGSTDTTFGLEGTDGEKIFLHLQDKNAYELRCRSNFTFYCRRPATLIYWNDIVNT